MTRKYKTYPIEIDGSDLEGIGDMLSSWIGPGGGSDVKLNFEARVAAMLDLIEARTTGKQVFGNLPKGEKLLIVAYTQKDAEVKGSNGQPIGVCNAYAKPSWWKKGSVHIDPLTWKPGATCTITYGTIGADNEEVLLHEILHSLRILEGHYDPVAFNQPDKAYDTIEEFFAIVVTNIYMSEKGKTVFRKDHAGFAALPAKWATSAGFLSDADNLKWVKHFADKEGTFIKALDAALGSAATFNPFHELLTNPAKYAPPAPP